MALDRKVIGQRQDTYLTDHYLTTHATTVSVALGVAGLSAASLLAPVEGLEHYKYLLWLLWSITLANVATAYAATITGAIVLPARLPAVVDLLLPLLIGMSEFLLFGVLTTQVTGFKSPVRVLVVWWYSMAIYGLLALFAVWRAHSLIKPGPYNAEIKPIVDQYLKRQRWDMVGTGLTAGLSGLVGTYHLLFGRIHTQYFENRPPVAISLVLALPVALISAAALTGVGLTARELRIAFARAQATHE